MVSSSPCLLSLEPGKLRPPFPGSTLPPPKRRERASLQTKQKGEEENPASCQSPNPNAEEGGANVLKPDEPGTGPGGPGKLLVELWPLLTVSLDDEAILLLLLLLSTRCVLLTVS